MVSGHKVGASLCCVDSRETNLLWFSRDLGMLCFGFPVSLSHPDKPHCAGADRS